MFSKRLRDCITLEAIYIAKKQKKKNLIKLECFYYFLFSYYRPFVHPAAQVGTPDPFPAPVAVVDSV